MARLHVEYAGGRIKYGILFIFGLFYEYSALEYVCIHVISMVNQAEYGLHIRVVVPQEYVNIYSTRCVPRRHAMRLGGMRLSREGGGICLQDIAITNIVRGMA